MAALPSTTRAFGAPSRYVQGRDELKNIKSYSAVFGKRVLILLDVFFYDTYKSFFEEIYNDGESKIRVEAFGGETTEKEILRVTALADAMEANVVVGMGGGKTMDTAKAVADNRGAAVIIVPTTASTDAPTISLSVLYSEAGEHLRARHYHKNPDFVLLDTAIIAKAPIRFIVAGMGDALSTYVEARANQQSSSANYIGKGYQRTLAAMAIAKACHETILSKGVGAKIAAENGLCTPELEDVIEANTLLSGLGVQNTSCAGAHSIAEGLTVLPACAKLLHGEAVAFGILVQLIIEGRPAEEVRQMYDFFDAVGLPTTFADLRIPNATLEDIMKVAEASLHSYWDVEPFCVNAQMVSDAIFMANALGVRNKTNSVRR